MKNRIIEYKRMRLGDVKINAANPRMHPKEQKDTLNAVTREVGWLGTPIAYYSERNGGALVFVDGNLRGAEYPDEIVEVAITDLTDAEAQYALLVYDPLSGMAEIAAENMDALLRSVTSGEEAVQQLLSTLAVKAGLYTTPEEVDPYREELDKEMKELEGTERADIILSIAVQHADQVKEWLANGEPISSTGMGNGVLKRCGLL